jgi:2-dehydro-3-deoxyglucarate aldolase/4-hydroxy-2-oxoheptanedioate aldolase
MKTNHVKQRLYSGGVSLGTMVFEFATTGIARLAAEAGAEFVVYDMEHTGWTLETIRMLLATSQGTDLVPMVRVPASEYHFLARVLDMGARGVMVPMVESVEQARRIAAGCRYPPVGRRGAAFTIAHDNYTGGDILEKMQSANREVLLIAQIETARGLEQVEEIAAVDGIDVLWIGHFDLSNFLGVPGEFSHPKFLEAVERVAAACRKHNKAGGFLVGSPAEARQRLEQGFRCLAYGGDLWMYQQTLSAGLKAVRDSPGGDVKRPISDR